jgi:ribosomal protein L29
LNLKKFSRPFLGAAALFSLAGVIGIPTVLWLPHWMVNQSGHWSHEKLTRQEYAMEVNEYRKTIAQILAGAGGLYALYLVFKRTHAAIETLETTKATLETAKESQITERFTKAIEQLGACDKDGRRLLEVRFGGIYALERIARDSPRDHGPIMEILMAYVRQNSPWDEARSALKTLGRDIQAILTVASRRIAENDRGTILDLANADLTLANLNRAFLAGADFRSSRLKDATFNRANLEGAKFDRAHLEYASFVEASANGACFDEAHLEGARFERADLEGSSFIGAHLKGATFTGARLDGAAFNEAYLECADFAATRSSNAIFSGAVLAFAKFHMAQLDGAKFVEAHIEGAILLGTSGLTIEQIASAYTDSSTKLPEGFRPSEGGSGSRVSEVS